MRFEEKNEFWKDKAAFEIAVGTPPLAPERLIIRGREVLRVRPADVAWIMAMLFYRSAFHLADRLLKRYPIRQERFPDPSDLLLELQDRFANGTRNLPWGKWESYRERDDWFTPTFLAIFGRPTMGNLLSALDPPRPRRPNPGVPGGRPAVYDPDDDDAFDESGYPTPVSSSAWAFHTVPMRFMFIRLDRQDLLPTDLDTCFTVFQTRLLYMGSGLTAQQVLRDYEKESKKTMSPHLYHHLTPEFLARQLRTLSEEAPAALAEILRMYEQVDSLPTRQLELFASLGEAVQLGQTSESSLDEEAGVNPRLVFERRYFPINGLLPDRELIQIPPKISSVQFSAMTEDSLREAILQQSAQELHPRLNALLDEYLKNRTTWAGSPKSNNR